MSNPLVHSYWYSILDFGPFLKGFIINRNEIFISGSDSCTGDSGGPLIYREYANSPWYQVGIVSYGAKTCARGRFPGFYTKVSEFLPWIQSKLKD